MIRAGKEGGLALEDDHNVAVIGGGPAGSFFSYFLLSFAERAGLEIHVDIYEPRDFLKIGPGGCNMCGGIISESLIQSLALEGIELPRAIVQRGIDSYVMHTEAGTCRIETPTHEKRIAAVHRGGGPRTARESRWGSFDGHLMNLAVQKGARVRRARVLGLNWSEGKPQVQAGDASPVSYDLLVGAVGVNSPELRLFENLGFRYQRPRVVKTYIGEIAFDTQTVREMFASAMHVFLLDLPRLDFAALIPKGDFVTLCLLGRDIDQPLIKSFFQHPAVKNCFPAGWELKPDYCHCAPKMYYGEARRVFADRVVLIGDCGVSRLYKDGVGAAFRTARAAARTAVFNGVSESDFELGYRREYRKLVRDNRFGTALFSVVHLLKHVPICSHAILLALARESKGRPRTPHMSSVLWDMFTGSSPYRDIFIRTLHPGFLAHFTVAIVITFYRQLRSFLSSKAATAPAQAPQGGRDARRNTWKGLR